jgi:hypothetical protein
MFVLTPPCDIKDSALIKLATSLSVMNFFGLFGEVAVEKPVNYLDLLRLSISFILNKLFERYAC